MHTVSIRDVVTNFKNEWNNLASCQTAVGAFGFLGSIADVGPMLVPSSALIVIR